MKYRMWGISQFLLHSHFVDKDHKILPISSTPQQLDLTDRNRAAAEVEKYSIYYDNPIIDQTVCALIDFSQNKIAPFNSLVIYHDGKWLKTSKTTKKLAEEFKEKYHINFFKLKCLAKLMEIYYKLPLIYGQFALAPIKGTSKAMTDWIGLHQMCDYKANKKGQTQLTFTPSQELILPETPRTISALIERSVAIMYANDNLLQDYEEEMLNKYADFPRVNVLEKYSRNYQPKIKFCNHYHLYKKCGKTLIAEWFKKTYDEMPDICSIEEFLDQKF